MFFFTGGEVYLLYPGLYPELTGKKAANKPAVDSPSIFLLADYVQKRLYQ